MSRKFQKMVVKFIALITVASLLMSVIVFIGAGAAVNEANLGQQEAQIESQSSNSQPQLIRLDGPPPGYEDTSIESSGSADLSVEPQLIKLDGPPSGFEQ